MLKICKRCGKEFDTIRERKIYCSEECRIHDKYEKVRIKRKNNNPYYKMKFVSEINGAEQDAYLTSENLSKLLNVQRVDTSISANGNTSTGNSLYLDSTQSL